VTLRKGRTWPGTAIAAVAFAAVTLLAAAGCSGSAPAASATLSRDAGHSLTIAAARLAYQQYVTQSRQYAADGDRTKGLDLVAAAAWAQARGQYEALASTGTPISTYRYGTPTFYVPALTGYPQWFMVRVPRATEANGHPGPVTQTLMVFDKLKSAGTWTLNGTTGIDGPLPALKMNGGYAVDVAVNDASLLLRPDVLGATQAAVVDEGPANPSAAVVTPGTLTTGLYTAQNAHASAEAARGLEYSWLLEGAPFPVFGLQTTDGGALVLYGMYLNTTTSHRNLVAGSPIPVPAGFTPLLAAPTEIGYHAVYANWTYQFAAVDPLPTGKNAKISVISANRAPSYGHAF
jgi:hypothetical protein